MHRGDKQSWIYLSVCHGKHRVIRWVCVGALKTPEVLWGYEIGLDSALAPPAGWMVMVHHRHLYWSAVMSMIMHCVDSQYSSLNAVKGHSFQKHDVDPAYLNILLICHLKGRSAQYSTHFRCMFAVILYRQIALTNKGHTQGSYQCIDKSFLRGTSLWRVPLSALIKKKDGHQRCIRFNLYCITGTTSDGHMRVEMNGLSRLCTHTVTVIVRDHGAQFGSKWPKF